MTKITLTDKKGQVDGLEVPNLRDPVADTDATNKRFVDAQLISKVDKVAGKGLSSEDFTSAEKAKLAAINAEENKALVDAQLISKVDKVAGKGLSSEDFTTAEKAKLAEVVMLLKGYWDQSTPLPVADSSNKGFTYFVTVEGNGYRAGEVITSTGVTWEKTTLSDPSLSVVGCAVNMLDPLPELLNATVSLEGSALLSGGVVSFFTVTDWVNGTRTVPAVANKATLTLAVPEYPCDPLSITVVAVDNYSNKSKVVTRTVAVQDTITMPPVPVVPVVPVVPIVSVSVLTFTSSALAISNGLTDVHVSTDWELWTGAGRTGTLVWSSINDTVNKTSVSVPSTVVLTVSSKYYLVVRYRSVSYGLSSYTEASFLISDQQLPAIGEPFQGGFYAGQYTLGGSIYALVVAPKAQGEFNTWMSAGSANLSLGSSLVDGLANCTALLGAATTSTSYNHMALCRGVRAGGFTDWYLPSYYELEVAYFNLKPTSVSNTAIDPWGATLRSVTAGNLYAIPKRVAGYTESVPPQTQSAKFQSTGIECMAQGTLAAAANYHITSSFMGYSSGNQYNIAMHFYNGLCDGYHINHGNIFSRAFRRVLLS